MRKLPVLALVCLALAGCSDAPDPDGATTATTGSPTTPAATAPSTDPRAPAPALTDHAVHIEGSTAAGACAVVQCHYEMTDTAFNGLESDGGVRLVGTLTWDPVSPTSEQLTLYVPTVIGGEYHWEPGYPSATGPSPLAFDLNLASLGGVPLGLIVGNGVAAGVPGGVVALQTPQPFVFDAVYTTAA